MQVSKQNAQASLAKRGGASTHVLDLSELPRVPRRKGVWPGLVMHGLPMILPSGSSQTLVPPPCHSSSVCGLSLFVHALAFYSQPGLVHAAAGKGGSAGRCTGTPWLTLPGKPLAWKGPGSCRAMTSPAAMPQSRKHLLVVGRSWGKSLATEFDVGGSNQVSPPGIPALRGSGIHNLAVKSPRRGQHCSTAH